MPRRIMDFDAPDRFAPGAVGASDERVFYLQAHQGDQTVSVMLEREQVAILADRVLAVVDELERRGLAAIDVAPITPGEDRSFEEPLNEDFRVGTMTIAWDEDVDQLVVEARSMTFDQGAGESAVRDSLALEDEDDIPDDAPIGPDVLRVRLTPFMAQQFARRAGLVVDAGRLPCPFCGVPLDASGHRCTRSGEQGYLH